MEYFLAKIELMGVGTFYHLVKAANEKDARQNVEDNYRIKYTDIKFFIQIVETIS